MPSGNSISTFVIFFDGVTFSVTRIGMKVFDEDTFGFLIALLLRLLYSHFPKVKYFILCFSGHNQKKKGLVYLGKGTLPPYPVTSGMSARELPCSTIEHEVYTPSLISP